MLISFEIKNTQEDYAKCLEFIRVYENKGVRWEEKRELLLQIISHSSTFIVKYNPNETKTAYIYLEQPITYMGTTVEPGVKSANKVDDTNINELWCNDNRKGGNP